MELLIVPYKIRKIYRKIVKGNNNISNLDIRKKLTRNMLLAYQPKCDETFGKMYQYGNLWFMVKDNKVVWLKNHCPYPKGWKKDIHKYNELNRLLGIDENKEKSA